MSELTATVDERAAAAQAAHEYAWKMQRQADREGRWIDAAFWAETCESCLEELTEDVAAMRAGVDRQHWGAHGDDILRANADLASESAYYPPAREVA